MHRRGSPAKKSVGIGSNQREKSRESIRKREKLRETRRPVKRLRAVPLFAPGVSTTKFSERSRPVTTTKVVRYGSEKKNGLGTAHHRDRVAVCTRDEITRSKRQTSTNMLRNRHANPRTRTKKFRSHCIYYYPGTSRSSNESSRPWFCPSFHVRRAD